MRHALRSIDVQLDEKLSASLGCAQIAACSVLDRVKQKEKRAAFFSTGREHPRGHELIVERSHTC
ncbi:MAG TPA: hypothetical protein VGM90_04635 [Kofleriaceae bacterium]|jgi:hypothetical protein